MATKHDNRLSVEPRDVTAAEDNLPGGPPLAKRKSPIAIDEAGIAELISFFRLLRKWKQEAECHEKMQ
jgi:hypothetical protein